MISPGVGVEFLLGLESVSETDRDKACLVAN